MNYQEFKNMLKDRMQKIMGDTIQVGFETYTKNNQTPHRVSYVPRKRFLCGNCDYTCDSYAGFI